MPTCNRRLWLGLLPLLLGIGRPLPATRAIAASPDNASTLVYIGTYSTKDEDGIHIYRLRHDTGALQRVGAVQGIRNPSFQTLHPNGEFLYSVSESGEFQGNRSGSVSSFAIEGDTGKLRFLNEQPTHGTSPCHLLADRAGTNVVVANYGSGSLAVLPIRPDGSLDIPHNLVQHTGQSVHPTRQTGPHAHCVNNDLNDRFIVSADLGLDKVMIYRYDRAGHALSPNPHMPFVRVKPGAGPRHFAFHPSGRFGYVINELDSTITAFTYDAQQGKLDQIQTVSTLPGDYAGQNTTAEVFLSPDGRFLYGSNRGHHSIVVFAVDPATGQLTHVAHHSTLGEQPRNFGIDPTGSFLLAANQRTGNVVVFRIDRPTGQLAATEVEIKLSKPVCVTFLPQP